MAVAAARDKTQTLAVQEKLRHEVELKKQEEAKKELKTRGSQETAQATSSSALASGLALNSSSSVAPGHHRGTGVVPPERCTL